MKTLSRYSLALTATLVCSVFGFWIGSDAAKDTASAYGWSCLCSAQGSVYVPFDVNGFSPTSNANTATAQCNTINLRENIVGVRICNIIIGDAQSCIPHAADANGNYNGCDCLGISVEDDQYGNYGDTYDEAYDNCMSFDGQTCYGIDPGNHHGVLSCRMEFIP